MGVSSVTLLGGNFVAKFLAFIGILDGFLGSSPSLTLFALIPHLFQWKNVTLFAHFV